MDRKARIRKLLKEAKNEVNRFRETNNEVFLLQSAEKIWLSFVLLVEYLSGKDIRTAKGVQMVSNELIKMRRIPRELYWRADALHHTFYEGISTPTIGRINYCSREIKKVLRQNG